MPQRTATGGVLGRRTFVGRLMAAAGLGLIGGVAALVAPQSTLPAAAQRIVVAGGDLTEIVFALGVGDRVVGVDSTANHPEAAAERPQIGYVRRLSAEGVLSLAPDLLLAAHDAGPENALTQIAGAGVRVAQAPDAASVDAIPDKIRFVGQELGVIAEAEALATEFQRDLADVQAKVATLRQRPRVLFVLSLQRGTPLVGGTGTSAAEIIARAGGANAAADVDGYKPMSREAVIAAAPDFILMMSQHAERSGGLETVLARPEIALTPAGRSGNAIAMEGMLLLGFGPRTPKAIAQLARALHPDAAEKAGL